MIVHDYREIVTQLNALGHEGWELISITSCDAPVHCIIAILKRKDGEVTVLTNQST